MSLVPGARVGPYEIVGAIGSGGMGEVYRARDPELHRDVAIKVLPALFARDPERLARFEREARTLAALNHPHIAQVYGRVDLPGEDGSHGLVLEFIAGEDLSQRIARGALPLDEALPIALQIAEAVEAAHEQGIIHRDLKPANIKLREDGQVKVLDFGLAKALAPDANGGSGMPLDNSPTITSPFQMSQLGVILGTAAYMAPEQAKGRAVDRRADVWAFGCVLFEMLTGVRAFDGEDVTDVLAAIVRAAPDWSRLPADTPVTLRTLLRRCLEKDRRERLPDIGAARLELKDARAAGSSPGTTSSRAQPRRTTMVVWALAIVAALAAIAAIALAVRKTPAPDVRVYKSVIVPPAPLNGAPALRLQISPDGRRLAFVAPDQTGRSVLWIRPLDGFNAQPLSGTENASSPFWSPDSRRVGFTASGKLKTIDTFDGTVRTLYDSGTAPPGTWNADDVILFTAPGAGIWRIDAAGGKPAPVTKLREGERVHIAPFFLPDGRHFLFTSGADAGRGGVYVGSLDSPDAVRLLDQSTNSAYADHRLLFMRETTLMAQPFDPGARALTGSAVPVAEGIQINLPTGTGAFSASTTGVLVYQTGTYAGTHLAWINRTGKITSTLSEPKGYGDVQLSPDGRSVSVTISAGVESDVWIIDAARNVPRRFTFGRGGAAGAVWSRDGRDIIFGARRAGNFDLYRRPATGGGGEELLLHDEKDKLPVAVTPDGQTLLYSVPRGGAGGELWLMPLNGARTPRPFTPGDNSQVPAEVSPDGKWLAYVSAESGSRRVYITSFPDHVGKWELSQDVADTPRWRADGRRLFFISAGRMMEVDVEGKGNQIETGPPRELFGVGVPAAALGTRSTYAVTADGERFLVNTWDPRNGLTPITLVVNWTAGLRK